MNDNEDFYSPPRWLIVLTIVFIIAVILFGCKTKMVYVPVESVKTEWRDKLVKDSIYFKELVRIYQKGDTIFRDSIVYKYKDKLIKDTVNVTDTIRVPFPVEVEKEVNYITSFQGFQIWCGRIVLLLLAGWLVVRYIRK